MSDSILSQVLPYEPLATAYVQAKFGGRKRLAVRVVRKVLAGFMVKAPRHIPNPKRFLLRACRRHALRFYGGTQPSAARESAPLVLVALEDEDRSKFFGPSDIYRLRTDPADVTSEETALDWAATLGSAASPIRVEVRVVRRCSPGDAA